MTCFSHDFCTSVAAIKTEALPRSNFCLGFFNPWITYFCKQ